MDVVSEEKRSYIMSRIRGRDTKPEMMVRSALHGLGFRFTVRGPRNRMLPGRPDLVFPSRRTVLFVHGCFWHGHENCRDFRLPASRVDYWQTKIEGNRERDRANYEQLQRSGWRIIVVWACAVVRKGSRKAAMAAIADELQNGERPFVEFGDTSGEGFTRKTRC